MALTISIINIKKVDFNNAMRAFVDIDFGGIKVKGFKVMEGSKGLFVANPSQKGKGEDAKYYDTVYIANEEDRKLLNQRVIAAYMEAE